MDRHRRFCRHMLRPERCLSMLITLSKYEPPQTRLTCLSGKRSLTSQKAADITPVSMTSSAPPACGLVRATPEMSDKMTEIAARLGELEQLHDAVVTGLATISTLSSKLEKAIAA